MLCLFIVHLQPFNTPVLLCDIRCFYLHNLFSTLDIRECDRKLVTIFLFCLLAEMLIFGYALSSKACKDCFVS